MQFQQPFDATRVEPASFPPPPPMADYHVRIAESEAKPTADNSGGFLELTVEILDPGPYLNRKVPYRLNLFNKSQQTVEIAYRQLSAVCHVTGVFQINDSRQLHGIPFIATIGPQKDDPRYANVFAVKDINGVVPGKGGQQAAPAPTPAPAAAPAPTWGTPAVTPPAATPPWGAPPPTAAPPAAAPAPAWQSPAAAPPATPAPVWPGAPAVTAAPAPAPAAPPWAAGGTPPATPPWVK